MSKYPNDAKRLAILQDYLTSDLSKYAIAKSTKSAEPPFSTGFVNLGSKTS